MGKTEKIDPRFLKFTLLQFGNFFSLFLPDYSVPEMSYSFQF